MVALQKNRFIHVFLILGSLGSLIVFYKKIPRLCSYVSYPMLYMHHSLIEPLSHWYTFNKSIAKLQDDYRSLESKYNLLLAQNIRLHAILSHIEQTKELRDYLKKYQKEGMISRILSRSFQQNEHYFLIEGGDKQGVEKDDVVTYKNQLIGKVTDVYPWYSKVCLITDYRCKIAAFCPASQAHGIHEGIYDCNTTILTYVSHLMKVRRGEWVLSSGEGVIFPEGYALGRIETFEPDGLYQKITVKPACSLQEIAYCVIHKRCLIKSYQLPF